MNNILLTGSSGFIGTSMLELLSESTYSIHTISSQKKRSFSSKGDITCHQCNLLHKEEVSALIKDIKPDTLLHFAWDVSPGQYLHNQNNLDWLIASLNLFQTCVEYGTSRIIGAGTCFEYNLSCGFCSEDQTPLLPSSYYGLCKRNLYDTFSEYAAKNNVIFNWGRIFYLYGPHENLSRLIPSVINSCLKNEPVRCSHGNQYRDYLFVRDVAEAFMKLLNSNKSGPVNIGSGIPYQIKDIVNCIIKEINPDTRVEYGYYPTPPDDPPFIVADTRKMSSEFGWKSRYSLKDGIRETIDWWRDRYE